jgi:SAM-dependent methyltransferase
MTGSRWWKDFDTAVATALPPGSRVLDVGCGDGGLVDRLGELGFDALGVDPAAPAHPRLIREPAEHAQGLGTFDAVTAVMALHHAGLDAMTSALARLLRPDGRLFVHDFDWDAMDMAGADLDGEEHIEPTQGHRRFSQDSPTSTTSPRNYPQDTQNRISSPTRDQVGFASLLRAPSAVGVNGMTRPAAATASLCAQMPPLSSSGAQPRPPVQRG